MHDILMILAINGDMSLGEIQSKFPKSQHKTIQRRLTELVKTGKVEHKRIRGKNSKRKRYFIPENEKKDNLWTHIWLEKEKALYINYVSQRRISSIISKENKFYEKELKELKGSSDESFFNYHLISICGCLEWISRLTWAINSGILGDSKSKIELAKRNRERHETFLQKIIFNMKKRNTDKTGTITFRMYELLDSYPLLSAFYPFPSDYKGMLVKRY